MAMVIVVLPHIDTCTHTHTHSHRMAGIRPLIDPFREPGTNDLAGEGPGEEQRLQEMHFHHPFGTRRSHLQEDEEFLELGNVCVHNHNKGSTIGMAVCSSTGKCLN